MRTRAGRRCGGAGPGFTLIEILLATVLILLLLGAVIFNFSSLERGARLEEGASQFEALLRYARAHALSSGRQVQLHFAEAVDPDFLIAFENVRVTWEPDPLGNPGAFEDLAQTQPYVERINELVQVESWRLTGPAAEESATTLGAGSTEEEPAGDSSEPVQFIKFYPDGSADSAELVLVSRDADDFRRISLRLAGVTGVTKKSIIEESDPGLTNAAEMASPDRNGQIESAVAQRAPKAAPETLPPAP